MESIDISMNIKDIPLKTTKLHDISERTDKINAIVTNLYTNATKRLKLSCPANCAENLLQCHQLHYNAEMPTTLSDEKSEYLNIALNNSSYDSYLMELQDLCLSGAYPGINILTRILEIILSLNPKAFFGEENKFYVNEAVITFMLFIKTYPPCWRSLHTHYKKFFDQPLKNEKLTKNHNLYSTSDSLFGVLFDLLEENIQLCSEEDMRISELMDSTKRSFKFDIDTPEVSKYKEENLVDLPQSQGENVNETTVFSETVVNEFAWEEREKNLQTYESLTHTVQLERLFIALKLLLKVLEDDFVMWLLQHQQNIQTLFCTVEGPLVIHVFQLTKFIRTSINVERMFRLFANAVNLKMSSHRLEILERYISLIMNASIAADVEIIDKIEINYPFVSDATLQLIEKFFKHFKIKKEQKFANCMRVIKMLRMPFVRYEFIRKFLQMLKCSKMSKITPKTICLELLQKRYINLKIVANLDNNNAHLTRQQYFDLLLLALQDYCEWHGLLELKQQTFDIENPEEQQQQLRTYNVSNFRIPFNKNHMILLTKFEKNLNELEAEIDEKMLIISKPLVNLNIKSFIAHSDIIEKYYNDVMFLNKLNKNFNKFFKLAKNVDLSEWQKFLQKIPLDIKEKKEDETFN